MPTTSKKMSKLSNLNNITSNTNVIADSFYRTGFRTLFNFKQGSVNIFSMIFGLVTLLQLFINISKVSAQQIEVSPHDLAFSKDYFGCFSVYLSKPVNVDVAVSFWYEHGNVINCLPNDWTIPENSNSSLSYNVTAREAGHTTVRVNVTPNDFMDSEAFVRVNVYRNEGLIILCSVIGWIYFVAWSISFYPQIYMNWKRKSVVGLNFDFVVLNLTGFFCYSVYNLCFKYVYSVKCEYFNLFPTSIIPVELNDIVFAVHATCATIITVIQILLYERGEQRVSRIACIFLSCLFLGAAIFLIVIFAGGIHKHPWLSLLYYLSYVKLAITLTKYIPQAYFNCKRRSTSGWSIGNILLDFTGGFLSILQMFLIAYNFDDWISVFGNFTKFGLGFISILFDILFIVQHYCLFPEDKYYNRMESSDSLANSSDA
ncbi:cystinosin-like [Limulus polyphemus]|uniref:Cystinosin-like n=1 Tax=Limulus polyphemus TaxID=6850 RepID=A0ABM1B8Z9_LIMPO|nr:cystinosin-like [Limulus polyphemus]